MKDTNHLLSDRIKRLAESATIRMSRMSRELREQGHDIINLSLGEPDFDTPAHIKDAAKRALDGGYTKYTPVPGLPPLLKAIQAKFKRDNDLDFGLDQIVVSNGAKQSLANIALSLLNEGDEVIVLAPFWVTYSEIIKLAGATPIILKSDIEEDYKVPVERIAAAITPKTRMLLFSSPCNPTGSVYSEAELRGIADLVAKYDDIYIVADEIYEYINFTGKHVSIGAFDNVRDRTVTVNGFSKGFAMTGWRLGYIGAPRWIAQACIKMQGQFTSGANAFGQMAGAHALQSDMSPTHAMREAYLRRRDMVIKGVGAIPGIKVNRPQGAFYIFPDISEYFGTTDGETVVSNANDFCEYLLTKAHVATVTGAAFGADDCFRISYAASEKDLAEAVKRIAAALAKLRKVEVAGA